MIVQLNRLIVDSTSEELLLYTGAVSSVRSCVITHQSTTVRHQPGPGQGLVTQHPASPHQGGPGLKLAPTRTALTTLTGMGVKLSVETQSF